ncbi:MAG: fibronectin type III domain-containing protein, partial [Bacteroidales bacterium]|nr:fibronectin type III domain-containing protein [Bacteroidales bacterium]
AYIQLKRPAKARYVRYRNVAVSAPYLALSEIRVFGLGSGSAPSAPSDVQAVRCEDRRDALISWSPVAGAQGYNVYWGIAPDKLYSTWMVYGEDHLLLPSLSADQEYWFAVEAFNSCGVSELARAQAH